MRLICPSGVVRRRMWDFCVSAVAERGGIDPPQVQEPVDVTTVYASKIGYFSDIALKVVEERLEIVSPHLFENLFLDTFIYPIVHQ